MNFFEKIRTLLRSCWADFLYWFGWQIKLVNKVMPANPSLFVMTPRRAFRRVWGYLRIARNQTWRKFLRKIGVSVRDRGSSGVATARLWNKVDFCDHRDSQDGGVFHFSNDSTKSAVLREQDAIDRADAFYVDQGIEDKGIEDES